MGFLPEDWVIIEHRNLPKTEACRVEQELIRSSRPRFNKQVGRGGLKLTKDDVEEFKKLRTKGLSYKQVAEKCGSVTTMTVFRALNGHTKTFQDQPND
jgi:hypothetical protein